VRLLLGSSRPSAARLAAVGPAGRRVGVIANAHDRARRAARAGALAAELDALSAAGLAAEELDLRAFDAAALARYDVVWATGGNAFVLRRAMRDSGFDAALSALPADTPLVYVGWSAGACAAGSTLRGLELVDDVPARRRAVWDGLGLVDRAIVPHFESADGPLRVLIDRVVAHWEHTGTPYRALRDGETIAGAGQALPPSAGS
jgi:dipeptidase E